MIQPRVNTTLSRAYVPRDRSLEFTAASSQKLTKLITAGGSRRKFTLSLWYKRKTTGFQRLFNIQGGETLLRFNINFSSDHRLEFRDSTSSADSLFLQSSSTSFNNTTSWNHLHLVVDTEQATASNRARVWHNGTQLGWVTVGSFPLFYTQNSDSPNIGLERTWNIGDNLNGFLDHIAYLDGVSSAFTNFTTGSPGVPRDLSALDFGDKGYWLKFDTLFTTSTLGRDSSGNSQHFTPVNMTLANSSTDKP